MQCYELFYLNLALGNFKGLYDTLVIYIQQQNLRISCFFHKLGAFGTTNVNKKVEKLILKRIIFLTLR